MKIPQDSRYTQRSIKPSQQAKKSSIKRVGTPRTKPVQVKKQPLRQKTRLQGCLTTLGVIALLTASVGVVAGGIWLSILLMVNPNAVIWLNQFLPQWTRIPIDVPSPPQTLATIQNEIKKRGLIAGEPQALNSELLLPILASLPNCQSDCQRIVELRVYHPVKSSPEGKYYELVSQLPVGGPQEYSVLSVPAKSQAGNADLSRSLPLTKLIRFDEQAPTEGFWFNLLGQRLGGDTPMSYGQVIHYNPDQMHLSVMLQWTSPSEFQPDWQQITGNSTPEFVIDQTVGLEPRFKVYQIQPRNFVPDPIYLEEISLVEPALETEVYRNALMLAQRGLWSPAWQLLQSQKKKKWSATAQAQMDVIQLHAQFTQAQAKQAWASPSQQIFANLIDGRWADALLVFQSADFGTPLQEIVTLLKTDSGGLWGRVEAALKVNPTDSNVKAWGALILAAKEGRAKAIAWLEKPLSSTVSTKPVNDSRIYELLDRLEAALVHRSQTSHLSQIVGTAQQVINVNPGDWLQPKSQDAAEPFPPSSPLPNAKTAPLPALEPQQIWYQVQVSAFHDGMRWRQQPFSTLPLSKATMVQDLWKYLGLDIDSQIQVTLWTAQGSQESTTATVKAVSYRGGVIQLLAAGEVLSSATTDGGVQKSRLLAYSDSALRWIEPNAVTLSELNQVQPQWVSGILPILWRELGKSGSTTTKQISTQSGATPGEAEMLNQMGGWSVRPIDLTGNNEPDAVLTLYEDEALEAPNLEPPGQNSQPYKPRTLIISDTGALLYSEFSKDANTTLMAIADLGDGGPAALVIGSKNDYSLKRWSSQRQRFE